MVLCSVSAFGRVYNDYAFGYVAVLRRPRSGYSRRSLFSGGHYLSCVCVVVSVGVLVFVGYTMTCFGGCLWLRFSSWCFALWVWCVLFGVLPV